MCQNAEKIARGALVTTKQEEMAEARKRMLVELITGAINHTQKPNPEMMTCLFKSNSARYHRKAEGCRGDTRRVVMEKKKTPTIRRNNRQSTDTRKVVKLEVDTDKVE